MENKQIIKQTKYGWVDLSNLSKRGKLFDWKSSVGAIVEFQYFDVEYTMSIVQYIDWNHIRVSLDGHDGVVINTSDIMVGKFGKLLGRRVYDFRYHIGDVVNDTLLITSAYRDGNRKCYSYRCLIDGYENHILEINLHRGVGCPVCTNKAVMPGVNDIATTNPKIASLFYDINDTKKYTSCSGRYAYFKCPRCGCKIKARVSEVVYKGLSCKKCSDGVSYPNKFVYNFMEQLANLYDINGMSLVFTPEKIFPWSMNFKHENKKLSGKKIYDMYIDTHNIIIENHGNYHYEDCFGGIGNVRSLAEVKENDSIKQRLAILNGIDEEKYIVLDCHRSDMLYIKNSIMSSNLPKIFGFVEDDIDWDKCDKFATSSRVYEACRHWNNGIKNFTTIASMMRMNKNTVYKYIRKGRELNIITD